MEALYIVTPTTFVWMFQVLKSYTNDSFIQQLFVELMVFS